MNKPPIDTTVKYCVHCNKFKKADTFKRFIHRKLMRTVSLCADCAALRKQLSTPEGRKNATEKKLAEHAERRQAWGQRMKQANQQAKTEGKKP